MALPHFRSLAARARRQKKEQEATGDRVISGERNNEDTSERTLTPTQNAGVDIKLATKTRKIFIILSSFLFLISTVFLILTIIGNINTKVVIRDTYFYKLDLTNVIPSNAQDIVFTNSLARSLGLHDFYQVGLWNFCEGYNNEGITYCSHPKALYWFNPVETLVNELLSGATLALPAEVGTILKLLRIASHIMFGFYLTGVCMNAISIFIAPLAIYSRWWSWPLATWTFIAALLTTIATIIATVIAVIFKTVLTSQQSLNIGASIGTDMFAFMWIGSGCSIFGWLIHASMMCCCASRRDVRTGRRRGRKSAYGGEAVVDEKKGMKMKMPRFRRKMAAREAV